MSRFHFSQPRDGGPVACNCVIDHDHDAEDTNKIYVIVGDGGLNGPWPVSVHRWNPPDLRVEYKKWYDDITARGMMHPYENGFILIEIDLETLEIKEIPRS